MLKFFKVWGFIPYHLYALPPGDIFQLNTTHTLWFLHSSNTDQLMYSWLMTTNVLLHVFSAHRIILGICLRMELMVTGYIYASFSRYCQKFSRVVIPIYVPSRSVKVFHRFTFFPPLDNVRLLILWISLVEIF